jgi:adenosylhomocysteine nucleosidase
MGIISSESPEVPQGGYVAILGALSRELGHIHSHLRLTRKISNGPSSLWLGSHGSQKVILIQTGVGPERAYEAAHSAISSFPIKILISAGFAGALHEEMKIGDLVVGESAYFADRALSVEGTEPYRADPHLLFLAEQASKDSFRANTQDDLSDSRLVLFKGPILTVRQIIDKAVEKRALGLSTRAIAVDMESAAVASAAEDAKIAYLSIRAISDLMDEDLESAACFISTDGSVRTYKGILHLISHPSAIVRLNRLRVQTAIASKRLGCFIGNYLRRLD